MDVAGKGDALQQSGVDSHAHHDKETLKGQREQPLQVILAHMSPFPVYHRTKGDGSDGHGHVDFQHASDYNDEDTDGYGFHGEAQYGRFQVKPQKLVPLHRLKLRLKAVHSNAYVQVAADNPGTLVDHMLGKLKYAHHKVKGMGQNVDRAERLENPLKYDKSVKIRRILSRMFFKNRQKNKDTA